MVPSTPYAGEQIAVNATAKYRTWAFPLYRADTAGNLTVLNEGTAPAGLVIAEDVAEFTYDDVGNLLTANNGDARVTRTYSLNGQLKSETQQIRTYAGADFSQHSYHLEYKSDMNGRRTEMLLPQGLVEGAAWMRRTLYGYDPATGALQSVGDPTGESRVVFDYNEEGQLRQLDTQAGSALVSEQVRYDATGRARWQNRTRAGVEIHRDTFAYDPRGKVVRSWTMGDSTANVYSGLGMLAWSASDRYESKSEQEEEHVSDALGNAYLRRQVYFSDGAELTTRDSTTSTYAAKTGRLVQNGDTAAWNWNRSPVHGMVYDSAGNQVRYGGTSLIPYPWLEDERAVLEENTHSYYAADGKLRVIDRRTCAFGGVPKEDSYWGASVITYYVDCVPPPYGSRATFEEHRYDALGRRVLTRATQGWACELYCVDGVTRTVWDGDQIVAEIRAPMQTPERDSGVATELGTIDQPLYGRVLYQHAGGLDRPAVMVRLDYDSIFPGEQTIIPQTNWLGNYDSGTFGHNGSDRGRCVRLPKFDNEEQTPYVDPWGNSGGGDNQASGDSINHCVEVHWPAPYLWKTFQSRPRPLPRSWMGSLIQGGRDESGQLYRRNRYYDPSTGRFTQEDPIGIAGGLNVYGFANGDPVSYSDPYGLAACPWASVESGRNSPDMSDCTSEDWQRVSGRADPDPVSPMDLAGPIRGAFSLARAGYGFLSSMGNAGFARLVASDYAPRVVSRIGEHSGLTRHAARLSGAAQESVDALTGQLARGNLNPGIGTKHLFGGVFEARARDGARVYFRHSGETVEILAKSTKGNQTQVINILRDVYGK